MKEDKFEDYVRRQLEGHNSPADHSQLWDNILASGALMPPERKRRRLLWFLLGAGTVVLALAALIVLELAPLPSLSALPIPLRSAQMAGAVGESASARRESEPFAEKTGTGPQVPETAVGGPRLPSPVHSAAEPSKAGRAQPTALPTRKDAAWLLADKPVVPGCTAAAPLEVNKPATLLPREFSSLAMLPPNSLSPLPELRAASLPGAGLANAQNEDARPVKWWSYRLTATLPSRQHSEALPGAAKISEYVETRLSSTQDVVAGIPVWAGDGGAQLYLATGLSYTRINEVLRYRNRFTTTTEVEGVLLSINYGQSGEPTEELGAAPIDSNFTVVKEIYNSYNALDIPVSIGWSQGIGRWGIYAEGGVLFNLWQYAEGQWPDEEALQFIRLEDSSLLDRRADLTFSAAVGIEYRWSREWSLRTGLTRTWRGNSLFSAQLKYTAWGGSLSVVRYW